MIGFERDPRYVELIRRIWGEDAEIVPPGIILEIDRPEWRVFKRELAWTTGDVTIAAAAANFGKIQVQNPANSGRISVVTDVLLRTVTAGTIVFTIDSFQMTTPAACLAVDTRLPIAVGPGAPTVATISRIDNSNATIGGWRIESHTSTAGSIWVPFKLVNPVILSPGHNFTLTDAIVNEVFEAYIFGYEHPIDPEELVP